MREYLHVPFRKAGSIKVRYVFVGRGVPQAFELDDDEWDDEAEAGCDEDPDAKIGAEEWM